MRKVSEKDCTFASVIEDCQTIKQQKENEEGIICYGSCSCSHHELMLQQEVQRSNMR
jgi:hypothetical protein